MRTRKVFLCVLVVIVLVACGTDDREAGERFISYYEDLGELLIKHKDAPDDAVKALKKFIDKRGEDYAEVVTELNAYAAEKKKEFVQTYGERLAAAFDVFWEIIDYPVGDDERIGELLEQLPALDLMAFNEFFE